jgi:hypothetical protein
MYMKKERKGAGWGGGRERERIFLFYPLAI